MLHLAHPNPIPWNTVAERMASIMKVDLVPYSDWLARLESERIAFDRQVTMKRGNVGSAKRPAAFQLLDIVYRNAHVRSGPEAEAFLPKLSTEIAERVVPALSSVQQLNVDDVDKWMTYWKSVGLF
jgi:hypothetical protein